jgi:hypothetical protein
MTNNFYPLALGNEWKYQQKDGTFYTNTVTSLSPANPNEFIMINSMMKKNQLIRKDGDNYLTDAYEEGTLNVLLKNNAAVAENWEIKFKANGLDSLLIMTVKELNTSQTVNGKTFSDVIIIEAESKIIMNGNLMPLNYFTQYYYANEIGLILTTSSAGDSQSLMEYKLN